MELIDSHCHIDVEAFAVDRAEVLASCRQSGLIGLVVPAIQRSGWAGLLAVCHQHSGLYPALGLHPVFLEHHQTADLAALEKRLAESNDLVAVGEIGLDYYIADLDRKRQGALFDAQLAIAKAANLPVILHVRKAHEDVLSLLKHHRVKGGIVHAFNGSIELAKQYQALGFKLGFGGSLSYARAKKLRTLAKALPLTAIVLETDAPDMVGEKYRGQRNSPAYLPDYMAVLSELRDEPIEAIAKATCHNVRLALALPPSNIL